MKELIGLVPIDSGQLLIVDPCNLNKWKSGKYEPNKKAKNDYAKCCQLTVEKIAGKTFNHLAIASQTNGDGVYPVFADIENNKIKSLTIKFEE